MNLLPILLLGGLAAYGAAMSGALEGSGRHRVRKKTVTIVMGKPSGGVWQIGAINPQSVQELVDFIESTGGETRVLKAKPDMNVFAITGLSPDGPRMIFVIHESGKIAKETFARIQAQLPQMNVRLEPKPFVRKYLTGRAIE